MIKPIGDKLLVERVPSQEKTEGGIVLPDTVIDSDSRAVEYFVVAVGDGKKVSIKPREFLLASTYAGKEVVQGQRKLRLIEWADVLAQVIHPDVKKAISDAIPAASNRKPVDIVPTP